MKKTTWPGNWKVTCMLCGSWFPSSEIKKRWDGLYVCKHDFEPRHPQTLIKISPETSVPDFVSKDVYPDIYTLVCGVDGVSAFADMGTADCMQADKASPAYSFLYDINKLGHGSI